MASRRLPTPDGPARIRLGGNDACWTARASKATNLRWPTTSRNGISGVPGGMVSLLVFVFVVAAAEDTRPEPAALAGRWRGSRAILHRDRGRSRRRNRCAWLARGGRRTGVGNQGRRRLLASVEHRGYRTEEIPRRVQFAKLSRLGAGGEIFCKTCRPCDAAVFGDDLGILQPRASLPDTCKPLLSCLPAALDPLGWRREVSDFHNWPRRPGTIVPSTRRDRLRPRNPTQIRGDLA